MASAAEVIHEPEDRAESDTEDDASGERKIERAVSAAMDDVSGQAAEAERESGSEVKKSADDDQYGSEEAQGAAELLVWVHG